MFNKISKYIKEKNLIKKNDKILIAFSGGPDSAFLLYFFVSIRLELNLSLELCYVNHMLRGKDSDKEEAFAVKTAKQYKIKLYKKKVNLKEKIENNNLEALARSIRYDFFKQCITKTGFNKIATAHNKDDNAETIFMNLVRGCGLNGVCGIEANQKMFGLKVIRPLLNIYKKDITEYCRQYNIKYVIDASNLKQDFTRNRVRLDIFPKLEKKINKNVKENLINFSNIASESYDYILSAVNEIFIKKVKKTKKGFEFEKELLQKQDIIAKELLRKIYFKITGNLDLFEKSNIDEIFKVLKSRKANAELILPQNIIFKKEYNKIFVYKKCEDKIKKDFKKNKVQVKFVDINIKQIKKMLDKKAVVQNSEKVCIQIDEIELKNIRRMLGKSIIFCDYDKIKGKLFVRTRMQGDKFIPFGMKKEKKLKDYFIDNKIGKEIRENTPIICDQEKIIWIYGLRQDERVRVNQDTKKIIQVEVVL